MDYRELATRKPFVVNKNLGSAVEIEPEELNRTNADGLPVINPTLKQKYDFDRKGWLLIPSVLSKEDITEMRDYCVRLQTDNDSIPESQRCGLGGPLQKLADHPVVVGFLNEFLAYPPVVSEVCYGFRMEETEIIYGDASKDDTPETTPNKGNGLFRLPGDSHIYRCVPGRGWSGLTRAIWELSDINETENDFRFITGSHKSAYQLPKTMQTEDTSIWETYACPAGSVLFITESLTQKIADTPSVNLNVNRLRVFNMYNTLASRWSNWLPHPELLALMPEKRQSLFRDTFAGGNVVHGEFNNRTSAYPME